MTETHEMVDLRPSPHEPYRMEAPAGAMRRRLRRTVDMVMSNGRRMECYLRGGVCWPSGGHPDQYGALVVGAQDVQTLTVYIVAEGRFLTIDPCIDRVGGMLFTGAAARFNDIWAKLYCQTYYYREEEGEHRRWMLDILRSPMIQPKPQFVRIDWGASTEALVDRWLAVGRLRMAEDGESAKGMTALRSRPGVDGMMFPAVRALAALLAGIERNPWKWSHVTELD